MMQKLADLFSGEIYRESWDFGVKQQFAADFPLQQSMGLWNDVASKWFKQCANMRAASRRPMLMII